MKKKGRLERVRAYLEQKGWEYEYHEEDGCGSIDFSYMNIMRKTAAGALTFPTGACPIISGSSRRTASGAWR